MADTSIQPPLLAGWECKEIVITTAIIARYKFKKQQHLHCAYCLKVLPAGVHAIMLSMPDHRNHRRQCSIFCGHSCRRHYTAEKAGMGMPMGSLEQATLYDINFSVPEIA